MKCLFQGRKINGRVFAMLPRSANFLLDSETIPTVNHLLFFIFLFAPDSNRTKSKKRQQYKTQWKNKNKIPLKTMETVLVNHLLFFIFLLQLDSYRTKSRKRQQYTTQWKNKNKNKIPLKTMLALYNILWYLFWNLWYSRCSPWFADHTNKVYIFRQYTYIMYHFIWTYHLSYIPLASKLT